MKTPRHNTPTILQMEAVECGAASLGMILGYFGKFVPLEELRISCDITRDGSKASNLVKAAKKYGLQSKGFRKEPNDLLHIPLPAIIHWNFNHFLVLEGLNKEKNKVYLNDPAEGKRIVDWQTLEESFSGVVLTFEPTEQFVKSGKKPNIFEAIYQRFKGYHWAILYIFLVNLLLVVPNLAIPVFLQVFIDDILIENLTHWFLPFVIGMLLVLVLKGVLEYLKNKYLLRLETELSVATSTRFFWHVLRLPVDFFQQRFAGDIALRVKLNENIAQLIANHLAKNLLNIFLIVFYFVIMLNYDVWLTLAGAGFATLNLFALQWIARQREQAYSQMQNAEGKLMGVITNGLQTIESIKARGGEDDFFKKWAGYMSKMLIAQQKAHEKSILLNAIPHFLHSLTVLLVLVIGGLRVMEGHLTIGMLVAFQSLMLHFLEPVQGLLQLGGRIQEAKGEMSRLEDVLKAKIDEETTYSHLSVVHPKPLTPQDFNIITQKLEGHIEFRNVTFGYSRLAKPLIENFSLTIRQGERVALVGGSGSGKSTIAKLLAGLYTPWEGEILLDGKPRRQIPREVINNSIAMVSQDIFMFEGTTKEIITLWDSTIPDTQIIQAAKDAQIHGVIASRKNGYESIVQEGGKNFSGGQRQRLEIARALVHNPSILILDEATSALDPLTEKQIEQSIRKRSCSVLVIAHRLSTIRDCDEIIVMRYGKIIERGTHESLMALNQAYAALIRM
ncbi:MAG: NHLP family bacteriocin export ABC transporter peptidase/permease/ATPase subunit [Microscillaceae bacterium]|nr:NHLP family bacteriocin export ABC transporter peptidase/permease/ATPase subunit [Microscillaceae bacterium]MDW8461441.1 NHLP family bacteriocin export ABC transporter peptidase/permease/ATPase subunit [Cytophagales bacterium]